MHYKNGPKSPHTFSTVTNSRTCGWKVLHQRWPRFTLSVLPIKVSKAMQNVIGATKEESQRLLITGNFLKCYICLNYMQMQLHRQLDLQNSPQFCASVASHAVSGYELGFRKFPLCLYYKDHCFRAKKSVVVLQGLCIVHSIYSFADIFFKLHLRDGPWTFIQIDIVKSAFL